MPTTVESSRAIPEPSTVAATTQRPCPLERASGSVTVAATGVPPGAAPLLIGGRRAW